MMSLNRSAIRSVRLAILQSDDYRHYKHQDNSFAELISGNRGLGGFYTKLLTLENA